MNRNLLPVWSYLCHKLEDCEGCPFHESSMETWEECKEAFSKLSLEKQVEFVNEMAGDYWLY